MAMRREELIEELLKLPRGDRSAIFADTNKIEKDAGSWKNQSAFKVWAQEIKDFAEKHKTEEYKVYRQLKSYIEVPPRQPRTTVTKSGPTLPELRSMAKKQGIKAERSWTVDDYKKALKL